MQIKHGTIATSSIQPSMLNRFRAYLLSFLLSLLLP
jgi:hypothetical protein